MTPGERWVADALRERGLYAPIKAITDKHHVPIAHVLGRERTKRVARARHMCWAHLRKLGFSYPEIGALWRVCHSTVFRALRVLG